MSWNDVRIILSLLFLVSWFYTSPEVKFHVFGTSKHGEKTLSDISFAILSSTLRRFYRVNEKNNLSYTLACECIRAFLALFGNEKRAVKQVPSHAKEKHKRLDWATCSWAIGSIRIEVWYFRTSNRISLGSFCLLKAGQWEQTVGMRLLAFHWKSPTSLSARTICDINGDFHLIWLPTSA